MLELTDSKTFCSNFVQLAYTSSLKHFSKFKHSTKSLKHSKLGAYTFAPSQPAISATHKFKPARQ